MIDTDKRLRLTEWLSTPSEQLKYDLATPEDSILAVLFEFLFKPDQNLELFKSIIKKLYEVYQLGASKPAVYSKHRVLIISLVPLLCGLYIRVVHQHPSVYHSSLVAYPPPSKSSSGSITSLLCSPSKNDHIVSQSMLYLPPTELMALSILLLAIYNTEVIEASEDAPSSSGKLKTVPIRTVTIAKPSIYHETNANTLGTHSLSTAATSSVSMTNGNVKNDSEMSVFGPHPEREHLNMSNYQQVFTVLLQIYNQHIAEVGRLSHASLCQYFLGLMRQGQLGGVRDVASLRTNIRRYLAMDEAQDETEEVQLLGTIMPKVMRVQWSADLLVQITKSVHFCYFNHQETTAGELLNEICYFATHKLQANVLLMVNAFKNSLCINNRKLVSSTASQELSDALADVNLNTSAEELSGFDRAADLRGKAQWRSSYKKIALTNASFKTRKLPEDIPIVADATPPTELGSGEHKKTPPLLVKPSRSNSQTMRMESIDEETKDTEGVVATKSGKKGKKLRANKKDDKDKEDGNKGEGATKKMKNLFKEFKDKRTSSKEHHSSSSLVQSPPPMLNGKVTNARKGSAGAEIDSASGEEIIPMKTFNSASSANALRFAKFDEEDDEEIRRTNEGDDGESVEIRDRRRDSSLEDTKEGEDGATNGKGVYRLIDADDEDGSGESAASDRQLLNVLNTSGSGGGSKHQTPASSTSTPTGYRDRQKKTRRNSKESNNGTANNSASSEALLG